MVRLKMCVSQNCLAKFEGSHHFLDCFFKAKKVSGSQKRYQSCHLAKCRIYHLTAPNNVDARFFHAFSPQSVC